MTHVKNLDKLGLYGQDLIHNPADKSYEGFFQEEDVYQILDFLSEDEVEFCKRFYYDKQMSEGVQLSKSHFFLVYPLDYPELKEILIPKLNNLFGEWYSYNKINDDEQKQSSDFFFWQQGIFAPHTDSIIHIANYIPYKDVLIPLEMYNNADAPYYSLNQRWYGRGCHFKYSYDDHIFSLYSDILKNKPYYEYPFFKYYEYNKSKMISKEWYDQYFDKRYPYKMLEGFSINKMVPWTPGSAIINDTSVIHGATNYKKRNGKFKLGITLRIFKYREDYNPSTVFSVLPQLQGFSECKYDPRSD
jgi:hypothetical protein